MVSGVGLVSVGFSRISERGKEYKEVSRYNLNLSTELTQKGDSKICETVHGLSVCNGYSPVK